MRPPRPGRAATTPRSDRRSDTLGHAWALHHGSERPAPGPCARGFPCPCPGSSREKLVPKSLRTRNVVSGATRLSPGARHRVRAGRGRWRAAPHAGPRSESPPTARQLIPSPAHALSALFTPFPLSAEANDSPLTTGRRRRRRRGKVQSHAHTRGSLLSGRRCFPLGCSQAGVRAGSALPPGEAAPLCRTSRRVRPDSALPERGERCCTDGVWRWRLSREPSSRTAAGSKDSSGLCPRGSGVILLQVPGTGGPASCEPPGSLCCGCSSQSRPGARLGSGRLWERHVGFTTAQNTSVCGVY